MPGLVGAVSYTNPESAGVRFAIASKRMLRHTGVILDDVEAPSGEWQTGRARLAFGEAACHRSWVERPVVFFHGDLDNADEIRRTLRGPVSAKATTGELVSAAYRDHGDEFVQRLEGAFCVSVIDPARGRVVVATDTFGNYPIYWHADQSGLMFASDLSALIAATQTSVRVNLKAVADYLTLGCVLEDRTLADGIRLLDPGTALIYDVQRGTVTLKRYASVESFYASKATDRSRYFDDVRTAFGSSVDRCVGSGAPLGLALSGGLDSRAILSAINGRGVGLRTYTLGVDGCADHLIGEQLAAIAHTRHAFFELNASYLRDFLPNLAAMVSVTDGMYLSHGLTEMLALNFIDTLGLRMLLRGHGGELAKAHLAWPLHTDQHVYTLSSLDELATYLSARANYVTPKLPLEQLLTPEAAAAAGRGSADSFQSVLRGTTLSPVEACSHLYLRELNRRFTIPSLELFRTRVDVRLPFVDRQFLQVLLAAPPEWRDSTEIHKALTGAWLPALGHVRNSNTGAPASAGRMTEAIWDKFNTLFKRLDLRGFRHYHNFDGWMRSMLLESVEAELLPSTARIQAFIRRDVLQRVISDTRSGAGDHAYLLQVLLILELWQRENGVEAIAA